MQTEALTFYHGTGRAAARSILECGARNLLFEEMGAWNLGREIRRALLQNANLSPAEDSRLHFEFKGAPGREYSTLWVSALRQLDDARDESHFQYGHFFATLNIANAYRYAMTPYRSEFIQVLAESLKVLNHIGDPLPETVAARYPEVARAIENPSSPVVLELRGIPQERLLGEKGSRDNDAVKSFNKMQAYPESNFPLAYRILDVTPADIVAVHDLSDWPNEVDRDSSWRPDPSRVAEARHSVQEWLANEAISVHC
jgi:hypothetical protein